jgi:hypothetical protein
MLTKITMPKPPIRQNAAIVRMVAKVAVLIVVLEDAPVHGTKKIALHRFVCMYSRRNNGGNYFTVEGKTDD